jgi:hypothetical protein
MDERVSRFSSEFDFQGVGVRDKQNRNLVHDPRKSKKRGGDLSRRRGLAGWVSSSSVVVLMSL